MREVAGGKAKSLVVVAAVAALIPVQVAAKIARPLDIPVGRVELDTGELLQMCRLRVDEQLVDRGNFQILDQPQIHTHPHAGKEVHRLFGTYRLCRAEDAVCSTHTIMKVLVTLADEEIACLGS